MNSVFSELKPLQKRFTLDSRVIWVEVKGLPLCAWTPPACKKVASRWGDPIFINDDEDAPAGVGRVCLKTTNMKKVSGKVNVDTEGMMFMVTIDEVSDWSPTILVGDTQEEEDSDEDSQYELESENDVGVEEGKGDNIHSFESQSFEGEQEGGVDLENLVEKDLYKAEEREKGIVEEVSSETKGTEKMKLQRWGDEIENENFVMEQVSQPISNVKERDNIVDITSNGSRPPGFEDYNLDKGGKRSQFSSN
ncbi:unnamed protein product [Lactuca virosa]|uniref:DUF4283 domain-containing protein n=1 Tax=Lactuca virosa TaxID=75947 RepID=A0AAU9LR31_9ASTR|nr:unnamed protein product [Lactuca virosa]